MTVLFATIDVGTNTVGSQLAELRDDGGFAILDAWGGPTRLGEGIDSTGFLSEGAIERTMQELTSSRDRLATAGEVEMLVVGTSALRDAANWTQFLERVERETGWRMRVLTGSEEADYSFHSAQAMLALTHEKVLVVDLGGGSTELVWGHGSQVIESISLPLGSVRLTERYVLSDPVSETDCQAIEDEIDATLARVRTPFRADLMVGLAGTFLTLTTVAHRLPAYDPGRHGRTLTHSQVLEQVAHYQELGLDERRAILGMETPRADIILAGALLASRLMGHFGFKEVRVSRYGLSHGLLAERAKSLIAGEGGHRAPRAL